MQAIRQRRYYFLGFLMFKAIHGLAPHYLCNDVTMMVYVHGYNTRSLETMNRYVLKYTKETCKQSFAYKGGMLWNDLLGEVKNSVHLMHLYLTIAPSLDRNCANIMIFIFIV